MTEPDGPVYEIAQLTIEPDDSQAFEEAVAQAVPLFQRARGCRSMAVQASIEHPGRDLLVVAWDTVEDHMIHFRESVDFRLWRELTGPFFVEAPEVQHVRNTGMGFGPVGP